MAVSCFFMYSFIFSFFLFSVSLSQDVMYLIAIKQSISHDPLNLLHNWNPLSNNCGWYGITCDPISGRVISLKITGYLTGKISSSIGNLTELQVLELQGNNFTGNIPLQIKYLLSLKVLNLSYNALSGSIPEGLGNKLNIIDLSNNQLSGPMKAYNFGKCENLHHLKLSNNFFVNEIPPQIGNCLKLETLLLDGNIFEGKIPLEIGRISQLRILDISRNSLTGKIPKELGNCWKLSVIVMTNLVDFGTSDDVSGGEFNAFEGGIPYQIFLLHNLHVFWAPRANLGGRLPGNWSDMCSLRVLNLGQNYFTGTLPESMVMCKNLTFLDLSSNVLRGYLPLQMRVPCMVYFNVSRNSLSGVLPRFGNGSCGMNRVSYEEEQDIQSGYFNIPVWGSQLNSFEVIHDLSWNKFVGSVPSFSIGDELLVSNGKLSYTLFLNNNRFTGSLPSKLSSNCNQLHSFSVNLSVNSISGGIDPDIFVNCLRLTNFEAQENQISGSIPPDIGNLKLLKNLGLRSNRLSGYLPAQLGELSSLAFLDLSQNNLTGSIPQTLSNATNLESLFLHHNRLLGEIPLSFSNFPSLTQMDLSFNNLSGHIPRLKNPSHCDRFRGNKFMASCVDQNSAPQARLPVPLQVQKLHNQSKFIIAMATCASVLLFVLSVVVFFLFLRRRKLRRDATPRKKMVVTFVDTPIKLDYDNVVAATGNFSIRNHIGTGGFGSTYKAELVPGFIVAVKRLSINRFQGIKQFDAEIRTVGRVGQKNLVTLIGYYVGESEMFLIYNYLSGGNLETFIHEKSGYNVKWEVIHKIAVDIAQATAFLHYSCVPRIVHRDIKPSNILLDEELNAYLSDFGLARLLQVSETHATTDVEGTFGYVAPEYATTCRVSDKSDVYSFGVVLLELMSGKKSLDPSFSEYGNGFNIVAWANLLIMEGRCSELFSPELWASGPNENLLKMLRLASACTVESLSVRPSMRQVLEKLKWLHS